MLMGSYLNQQSVWKQVQVDGQGDPMLNDYGEPIFFPSTSIRVRKNPITEEVTTRTGGMTIAKNEFFTIEKIKVEDILDQTRILVVEEYYDFAGFFVGVRCIG